jgi:hypothetical protein
LDNDKKSVKIQLDKDNSDVLLEGEYLLLTEERIRRSSEQTEYLKFVLIGIIGQFAIFVFGLLNDDNNIFNKIDKETLESVLLMVSAGVVVLTTLIFMFWLDHALTISVIDRFLKKKEQQNGILGWYTFRENYSKKTYFKFLGIKFNLMKFKIQLFQFSIFLSFLIPPILFIMIASISSILKENQTLLETLNYATFSIFTLTLLFGLAIWSYSGNGIYFIKPNKDEKNKQEEEKEV